MFRFALLAAAAAAAFALPQTASAAPGTSQCIWEHLPADGLNAYMAEAKSSTTAPNPTDYISVPQLMSALSACKVADDKVGISGSAFGALTQQRMAEDMLLKSNGALPTVLDAAYKRIDPATARKIGEAFENKDLELVKALIGPAVVTFQGAFDAPLDQEAVTRYVLARADMEYLETTF